MQKAIIIRDEVNSLPAVIRNDGVFVPAINKSLEVVGEDEEGIGVIYEKHHLKLIENPVTGEWWLMNGDGSPRIVPKNNFRPLVCKAHGWVTLPVPKNGCASLLKTALHYDNYITDAETKSNEMAWVAFDKKRSLVEVPYYEVKESGILSNGSFKVFIVVSDERSRLLRWMNWQNTNRYNKYYTYSLPPEKLADEMLWSRKFITRGLCGCDQHALGQKVFVERFRDMFFNGDQALFDRCVERVDLKELPDFYIKSFGKPLIKNNVTPDAKKIFRWESLTAAQREAIDRMAAEWSENAF